MICEPDDFLLVAQKWATDSAKVMVSLMVFDDPKEPVFVWRAPGRLLRVEDRTVSVAFPDNGVLLIDVNQWAEIGYADGKALPSPERMGEDFGLSRPGAMLHIWTTLP